MGIVTAAFAAASFHELHDMKKEENEKANGSEKNVPTGKSLGLEDEPAAKFDELAGDIRHNNMSAATAAEKFAKVAPGSSGTPVDQAFQQIADASKK